MITVGSVFDDNREALSLDWIGGRSGAEKPLTGRDAGSVAAPDLVGHLNLIHPASRRHRVRSVLPIQNNHHQSATDFQIA